MSPLDARAMEGLHSGPRQSYSVFVADGIWGRSVSFICWGAKQQGPWVCILNWKAVVSFTGGLHLHDVGHSKSHQAVSPLS